MEPRLVTGGEQHRRHPTAHRCGCGTVLERIEASTLLNCASCGENRWLV